MSNNNLKHIVSSSINYLFAFADKFDKSSPKIFMFHNIINSEDCPSELYAVNAFFFEKFILELRNSNRSSFSLLELQNNKIIDKYSFAITFDDAYAGVFNVAYPILKKFQIPFTIFMSISFIDKSGYLTKEQLKELSEDCLCNIASHGVDHVYYRELSDEKVIDQFNNSKKILEDITGKEIFAFAFPFGSLFACSIRNIKLLSKTRYKIGFSTIPSGLIWTSITSKYFLPRINVNNKYIISKIRWK